MGKSKGHPGASHWKAKTSYADIELMRELYADGMKPRTIAEKFEVHVEALKQWLYLKSRVNS